MTGVQQEIRMLSKQYREFVSQNKFVPWIVVISVLISYGISLMGVRIGIDAEANLNDATRFLDSWYSIGRFSLVFTKNLFGMRELNIMLANILMIGMMVLYGLFADFMFYLFSDNDKRMKLFYVIFPALFLTHPCYVQQYVFTVQCFEVALIMLLCLISVYLISRWSFEGKKSFLIPGLLLMAWSFGGYQAFVPFYMSAALSVYLVYYLFHRNTEKHFFIRAALRHVTAFLAGYVVYSLMSKAVILWKEGTGFQGAYLENQVAWVTQPLDVCISGIKYYIGEVIFGKRIFYPKTFLIFAILFASYLIYLWVKEKRKDFILYALAAALLALSPFLLTFYQGMGILMRTQLSLPFVAAFFGAAVVSWVFSNKKYMAAVATTLCLLCAVNQGTTSARAWLSAQMAYEHDKLVVSQLVAQMQSLDGAKVGQKVALIGQYNPVLPAGAGIREETIGYSFFEWDFKSELGVTKRGVGFMNALGYPYQTASLEEYAIAKAYSTAMPCWPAYGSLQKVGDLIVVKFSNPY